MSVEGNNEAEKAKIIPGAAAPPKREPIQTSLGAFFAEPLRMRDMDVLAPYSQGADDPARMTGLGEALVKRLARMESGDTESGNISAEMYAKFTEADLAALASGVADACKVGPLAVDSPPLQSLGAAVSKKLSDSLAQVQATLKAGFGSMSQTVKDALGENLYGLSAIRSELKRSPAVDAVQKALDDQQRMLKLMSGSRLPVASNEPLLSRTSAVPVQPNRVEIPPPLAFPEFELPPPEETPLGRAAIAGEESARQLGEVTGYIGGMAEKLTGLHTLFLTEVIPKWNQDLEQSAKDTKRTLEQAERSLFWAKWALVASAFLTVLMTGWQVWIGREYKLENDKQQDSVEKLLILQLEEARRANQQLAEEGKHLRESLERMTTKVAPPAPKGKPKASTEGGS